MTRFAFFAASLLLLLCVGVRPARAAEPSQDDIAFFEKKIRPLLVTHCDECHSAKVDEPKGGLLLDRKTGWEEGGDRGPAIEPGDPDKSLLVRAVRYTECDLQMPPSGKLTDQEIRDFEDWVRRGAPDPRTDEKPKAKP